MCRLLVCAWPCLGARGRAGLARFLISVRTQQQIRRNHGSATFPLCVGAVSWRWHRRQCLHVRGHACAGLGLGKSRSSQRKGIGCPHGNLDQQVHFVNHKPGAVQAVDVSFQLALLCTWRKLSTFEGARVSLQSHNECLAVMPHIVHESWPFAHRQGTTIDLPLDGCVVQHRRG